MKSENLTFATFLITTLITTLLANPGVIYAQGSGNSADKTQGNSHSNPDGTTNLANSNTQGVDKPYVADGSAANSQPSANNVVSDGNNGCGQDKKSGEPRDGGTHNGFDDNNGWCGGKNHKIVYVINPTPAPISHSLQGGTQTTVAGNTATSQGNSGSDNNSGNNSNGGAGASSDTKTLGASSLAFTGDLTDTIVLLSTISGIALSGLSLFLKKRAKNFQAVMVS